MDGSIVFPETFWQDVPAWSNFAWFNYEIMCWMCGNRRPRYQTGAVDTMGGKCVPFDVIVVPSNFAPQWPVKDMEWTDTIRVRPSYVACYFK